MPGWAPLPDQLFWVPEGRGAPSGCIFQEIPALDLCEHAGGKPAAYRVPHYTQKATGCAFGPFGLDMVLHFARGLDSALARCAVALTAPKGDTAYRLNALVLLGSYLILRHGWTAAKLAAAVGYEARAKFECSWSRAPTAENERVLAVRDCWAGVELATKRGWLDPACVENDSELVAFVARYRWTANFFDATWIIPGLLMVAADPVSVVCDASPSTCKRLFPAEECDECDPEECSTRSDLDAVPGQQFSETNSVSSLETVCRVFSNGSTAVDAQDQQLAYGNTPSDFVTFFAQSSIGLVVRANWCREEGMPVNGYDDKAFPSFGMEHANIRVVDKRGGLPKPEDIAKMLRVSENFLDPEASMQPAVLVHCKGGFGRSMILALCLAIYRFDLSGTDLLGWVRIARPGAITCRQQELFLKSLNGRVDVARFAKIRGGASRCQTCTVGGCTSQ